MKLKLDSLEMEIANGVLIQGFADPGGSAHKTDFLGPWPR